MVSEYSTPSAGTRGQTFTCDVLLVDDDAGFRSSLGAVLAVKGHQVTTRCNGREALEACAETPFDVLLIDLRLPDMTGLDLLAQVEEVQPEIDVLVITGEASLDSATSSVRPSTVAYLVKPIDIDRLLEILGQIARRRSVEAENQRLAANVQRGRDHWERTFDAIADAILLVDAAGIVQRTNRAFCERFLTSFDAVVGRPAAGLLFASGVDGGDLVDTAMTRHPSVVRDDLRVTGVFDIARHPLDLDGAQGSIYVLHDITERRRTANALREREKELFRAQKMEALGRLAGGIAHDFNNLLTIILGNTQLVLQTLDGDHPHKARLGAIREAADRSSRLTRQLLTFSRREPMAMGFCQPNAVVDGLQEMLSRVIRADITLVPDLCSDVGTVSMDPGQLEQVLLNLIINARDAMPKGGTITVQTSICSSDDVVVDPEVHGVVAGWVALEVRDTGSGISPEVRDKIFDPFFTTKSDGTGLGLSMVYGAVERSGGHVTVESTPGQGTTFRLLLPRVSAPPIENVEKSVQVSIAGRTALLVEDEAMIRELAADALRGLGLRVLTAGDGLEALEVARGSLERIDLMVTDVVLPRLGGVELAQRLWTFVESLPVLFITGYPDGELPTGARVLMKPFTMEQLAAKVQNLLAMPDREREHVSSSFG